MQLELISIIVSTAAIILSSFFAFVANKTNKKVNQKDFEISEELKYDLMRAIAVIKSYDAKIGLSSYLSEVSFEAEAKALSNFMMSPSYLLLIDAVSLGKRDILEMCFHQLANSKGDLPIAHTRKYCHSILDILSNNVDFKDVLDIDVISVLNHFCEMPSIVDSQNKKIAQKQNKGELGVDCFAKFLLSLGLSDPDLELIKCRLYNDETGARRAVEKGASYHNAGGNILERYKQLYKFFVIDRINSEPPALIDDHKFEEILKDFRKNDLDIHEE